MGQSLGNPTLKLTADGKQLDAGLKKAEAKLTAFQATTKRITESSDKLTSGIGDKLKGVLQSGPAGELFGLGGGLAAGGAAIALVWAKATSGLEKFNAEMERLDRLNEQVRAGQQRMRDDFFVKVGGKLPKPIDVLPEKDRAAAVAKELAAAQKELNAVGRAADKANDAVTDLNGGWRLAQSYVPIWKDALKTQQDGAKKTADELNKQRDALRDYVRELQETAAALKRLTFEKAKGFQTGLDDESKKLQVQLDQLRTINDIKERGVGAVRPDLAKFFPEDKSKLADSDFEAIAKVIEMQADAAAKGLKGWSFAYDDIIGKMRDVGKANQMKAVNDDIKAFTDDLQLRLDSLGKTADEVKLMQLERREKFGANLDQARAMAAMLKEAEAIEQKRQDMMAHPPQYVAAGGLLAGSAEAYSAQVKFTEQGKLSPQLDAAKQQLDQAKLQTNWLGKLYTATKESKIKVTTF